MFFKVTSSKASRFVMLISVVAALSACGGDSVSDAPISVTLLHINDHHSRLDEESTTLQLRNAPGATKAVTLPMGGFGRVAAAISEEASKSTNVIKLHAGDALGGQVSGGRLGEADVPEGVLGPWLKGFEVRREVRPGPARPGWI